ncbi:MAG: molybdopterin-dependent oxidoreductase [bacterium]
MSEKISRREFLKKMAKFSAVAAGTTMLPGVSFGAWEKIEQSIGDVEWKKAPCRFCGTGCGLLIGLSDGDAVAVKGDPECSVNKGLACVKGYHSVQALYGEDRITKAKVRKNGELQEVPIEEALDVIADKMNETIEENGKDSVAMYGSGQWTIPDGYAASKFFKGGIGTNNVEANARLCMASAVVGFLTTFGLDEPMGCYEDIDYADTFVTWGNNMAECHPVLFSRLLEQQQNRGAEIVDLATRTTRTSEAADRSILFQPQTDLALANAICHVLVEKDMIDRNFINKHVAFEKGETDIGYGLEENFSFSPNTDEISFEEYKNFLDEYAPHKVADLTGVPAEEIRYLASLYGDPNRKVVSYWCMGVNQHSRGTWMNNLIYNIHLLTGKISQPGNGPFSLTGQPSACGTVREVGTLTHKLPHGVVMNEEHRKMAADIWDVPEDRIDPEPSNHTVAMFRALDRGEINFMWVQVTNPMVTMPKLKRYREGAKKDDRFLVVSDVYPTPTTDVADVVLPAAMWIEQEGMYGNSERRTQHFEKMIEPPGEAMSDTWQLIEVARRMGYENLFPWDKENHIENLWEEYRQFHANKKHNMAPYDVLKEEAGVMWPYVNGESTKWRYNPRYDPAADPTEGEVDFYGKPDHNARVFARPYEPAAEEPDDDYPFWLSTGRVIEHWHSGSMTQRVKVLHQAVPEAYVEIHPRDAKRLGIRNGDPVKLTTRRGSIVMEASINERGIPAPGSVFTPFFDENLLVNELTLDSYCPLSKQPDYKKCAVRVEPL